MNTNSDKDKTITFYDYGESQNGIAVVRKFEDKVALCLSLEDNGDVEALLDRETVKKLVEAMQNAIGGVSVKDGQDKKDSNELKESEE